MESYYEFTQNISELYSLLSDDISRKIFWARLRLDVAPSIMEILHAVHTMDVLTEEDYQERLQWKDSFQSILSAGNRILLYGVGGVGRYFAAGIEEDGGEYSGFCDRNYEQYPNGLFGKKVYSPQWLLEHRDNTYAVVTSFGHEREIIDFLLLNHFPEGHILTAFGCGSGISFPEAYFEFPTLYKKRTAFVDGGCFDGKDSLRFADWCGGDYSEIFAFEPDSSNFRNCENNLKPLKHVHLIPAALGERRSRAKFFETSGGGSHLSEGKGRSSAQSPIFHPQNVAELDVDVQALDDIVRETKVGFIKMDIEGAELDALYGAKKTLLRDKPFLAICVYHVPGDTLAIMDYLHSLIPEYRFWLRHYALSNMDTVLYASTAASGVK